MEQRISKKICSICYTGENEEEQQIIRYGIELAVESICKTILLLLFALCIGRFKECVGFLVVICPLKANAGGIHCKTSAGCTAVMVLLFLVGMILNLFTVSKCLCIFIFAGCLLVCLLWAPSSTENNPITDRNIRIHKKIACIALLVFWYMQMMKLFLPVKAGYIVITMLSIMISVMLQEGVRRWKVKE